MNSRDWEKVEALFHEALNRLLLEMLARDPTARPTAAETAVRLSRV